MKSSRHSNDLQAVQKGRRRIETGGVPSGYVEDFDESRTKLAGFINSLISNSCNLRHH